MLILSVILAAGLWPFRQPRNDVTWLGDRNGVSFGAHGVIFSSGPQRLTASAATGPCALEIWLKPERTRQGGSIISFYSPTATTEFSLFQEGSSLWLRLHNQKNRKGPHFHESLGGVFDSAEPLFVTITSNSKMTAVYIDGVLTKTIPDFPLVLRNLQGQLVAGTYYGASGGWPGQLLGIAAYGRALPSREAAQHYETWTRKGRPESVASTGNVWLYLFEERRGRVAHEALGTGADLRMPERYTIVHPYFLSNWHPQLSDWSDILLNIAGFVPFGFFFCACFSSRRAAMLPAIFTILLGMSISLGMEVWQVYLPGRTSSLTDVIANTLGTSMGVGLYQIRRVRTLAASAGLTVD